MMKPCEQGDPGAVSRVIDFGMRDVIPAALARGLGLSVDEAWDLLDGHAPTDWGRDYPRRDAAGAAIRVGMVQEKNVSTVWERPETDEEIASEEKSEAWARFKENSSDDGSGFGMNTGGD